MLVSALLTNMASFGTFVAFVPAHKGSKPVPAVFSSLGEVYTIIICWRKWRSRGLLEIIDPYVRNYVRNNLIIRCGGRGEDLMITIY